MKSTKNRDRNITHFLYVLPNLIMYSFLSIVPIVLGTCYGTEYDDHLLLSSRYKPQL